MTREDFIVTVNQKNRFKIGTEITMTGTLGLVGAVLIASVSSTGLPSGMSGLETSVIYMIGVLMCALSIGGLMKIWREHQIETLKTNLNIKKNLLLIDKVASGFKWATIQKGEIREYIAKCHRQRSSSYEIRILADNGKVYIDIQAIHSRLFDSGERSKLIASIKEGFAIGQIEHEQIHYRPASFERPVQFISN